MTKTSLENLIKDLTESVSTLSKKTYNRYSKAEEKINTTNSTLTETGAKVDNLSSDMTEYTEELLYELTLLQLDE